MTACKRSETTTTTQENFSAMRGHVAPGVTVRMFDGSVVTVVPTMLGWRLMTAPSGQCERSETAPSGGGIPVRSCRSAAELEYAVVTYDGRWV